MYEAVFACNRWASCRDNFMCHSDRMKTGYECMNFRVSTDQNGPHSYRNNAMQPGESHTKGAGVHLESHYNNDECSNEILHS